MTYFLSSSPLHSCIRLFFLFVCLAASSQDILAGAAHERGGLEDSPASVFRVFSGGGGWRGLDHHLRERSRVPHVGLWEHVDPRRGGIDSIFLPVFTAGQLHPRVAVRVHEHRQVLPVLLHEAGIDNIIGALCFLFASVRRGAVLCIYTWRSCWDVGERVCVLCGYTLYVVRTCFSLATHEWAEVVLEMEQMCDAFVGLFLEVTPCFLFVCGGSD